MIRTTRKLPWIYRFQTISISKNVHNALVVLVFMVARFDISMWARPMLGQQWQPCKWYVKSTFCPRKYAYSPILERFRVFMVYFGINEKVHILHVLFLLPRSNYTVAQRYWTLKDLGKISHCQKDIEHAKSEIPPNRLRCIVNKPKNVERYGYIGCTSSLLDPVRWRFSSSWLPEGVHRIHYSPTHKADQTTLMPPYA